MINLELVEAQQIVKEDQRIIREMLNARNVEVEVNIKVKQSWYTFMPEKIVVSLIQNQSKDVLRETLIHELLHTTGVFEHNKRNRALGFSSGTDTLSCKIREWIFNESVFAVAPAEMPFLEKI